MRNLYDSGCDILGCGHTILGKGGGGHGGGHGGGGHHGGGGGFRGGFRGGWGGPGWGWPDYYDAPVYVLDYVDADGDDDDDDDEDDDVLGMIDIQSRQAEMNKLKNPTVSIAVVLLKYGQQVIGDAIVKATNPDADRAMVGLPTTLPGSTSRREVRDHLGWHQNELQKYAGTPDAFYPNADDLKKWVMQAYVEHNAVEEGTAYLDIIWGQMWAEITNALARLPAAIAKKVGEAMPSWVKWTAIGIGGVAALGLGLGIYRVVSR